MKEPNLDLSYFQLSTSYGSQSGNPKHLVPTSDLHYGSQRAFKQPPRSHREVRKTKDRRNFPPQGFFVEKLSGLPDAARNTIKVTTNPTPRLGFHKPPQSRHLDRQAEFCPSVLVFGSRSSAAGMPTAGTLQLRRTATSGSRTRDGIPQGYRSIDAQLFL